MPWQLAIAISIATNIATTIVQRHFAKRSKTPATIVSAFSYLCGVMPIGLTAGFFVFPHHINWSPWLVMLLVLEGSAMALSGWTGFLAARRLGVVPRLTIGQLTNITAILLGWTILGEGLSLFQFIGGTILLIAALVAIWAPATPSDESAKQFHTTSILLTAIASISLGVGLVCQKAILGHMQIGGGFLVGWGAQTFAMLVLAIKDITPTRLRSFWGYEGRMTTLMGLTNGFTGVFYVYAIVHSDNISLITAITSVSLPLTVFAAYVFLREREHTGLMWSSLCLSFVGILITALK